MPQKTWSKKRNKEKGRWWLRKNYICRYHFSIVISNDENIGNHGYIGDISADILEKNIDNPKIDQNL